MNGSFRFVTATGTTVTKRVLCTPIIARNLSPVEANLLVLSRIFPNRNAVPKCLSPHEYKRVMDKARCRYGLSIVFATAASLLAGIKSKRSSKWQ
ncbi:hypothetical protein GJ496_004700 [Pomphorhynchus laevis]|nr:hypothetical protein GJ496_004699 [Pomphorhynchus laevis]KAI0987538.1 hypothetical protein GJ496_004700 [Pomphorhynchus laevis]